MIRQLAAFGFAALVTTAAVPADALSFRDIDGKWCGGNNDYMFSANRLVIYFKTSAPSRDFQVVDYRYTDSTVTVVWLRDLDKIEMTFGEFRDRRMVLLADSSSRGPRREFRRC